MATETELQESSLRRRRRGDLPGWVHGIFAALWLYLFLCAINVMGGGLKEMAHAPDSADLILRTFEHANNPFVALVAAVLITAMVQSSSFTTSMIVTMAASGTLSVEAAIFAVMGANIGTSVTGILVALANMRIRRQFRRAFTAALMHDIFNLLTVGLLFPLEWVSAALSEHDKGVLMRSAEWTVDRLGLVQADVESTASPVKIITTPVVSGVESALGLVLSNPAWIGLITAIVGLALLAGSLIRLVGNLKGALLRRLEGVFGSYFFRNDGTSYVVGTVTTVLVQSSSISTSLIIPLAGAGAVKLRRVFPFILGANLGTTLTSVIAATAVINERGTAINEQYLAAVVATAHVLFNLVGTAIWYPLRIVPMAISQAYARLAAKSKRYAIIFLAVVFVVVPLVGLLITELFVASPIAD